MDVTTLSLDDPLEPARKATAEMLQNRERTFSLPQPFYTDAVSYTHLTLPTILLV